jgi:hypothetical protein
MQHLPKNTFFPPKMRFCLRMFFLAPEFSPHLQSSKNKSRNYAAGCDNSQLSATSGRNATLEIFPGRAVQSLRTVLANVLHLQRCLGCHPCLWVRRWQTLRVLSSPARAKRRESSLQKHHPMVLLYISQERKRAHTGRMVHRLISLPANPCFVSRTVEFR